MLNEHEQPVYFIGIALPEPWNTTISQLQWQLYDENNPRRLKPLLPHITLLHPPALAGTLPEELIPKVRNAAENYLPLNLEISDVRFFESRACTLQVSSFGLESLYRKIIPELPLRVQAEQTRRDFLPHITLAQIKTPDRLDEVAMRMDIEKHLALPIRFKVSSLACFKRILPRVYKPEEIG